VRLPPERSQRVGALNVGACCALLAASCISTDLDTADAGPLCLASESAGSRALADSVVIVNTDLATAGFIECSGVVIAPTLVLTDVLCIVLPIELELQDLVDTPARPSFDGRALHRASVDYAECAPDASWAPREDGDFSARLGELIDVSTVTVSVLANSLATTTIGIRQAWLAPAEYRCWDDLALLVLEQPIPSPPVSVRLTGTESVGDRVVLGGSGRGMRQPYEVPSTLQAVTFEAAEPAAPPRSLLIDEQVCDFESGGAVTSAETGELIGVIGDGTGDFCGDPSGGTLATRIAPFRRMLLEAARDAGEVLRVAEHDASLPPLAPCGPD